MTTMLLTILLAVGWALATGSFTVPNVALGAVLGSLALFLVRGRVRPSGFARKVGAVLALGGLFIFELALSAARVAWLVLRPDLSRHLRPGIIAFPLTVTTNAEITTLANLITLTPGTLSIDVSEDGKLLYVHALSVADRAALIDEIGRGFESKVKEAFR